MKIIDWSFKLEVGKVDIYHMYQNILFSDLPTHLRKTPSNQNPPQHPLVLLHVQNNPKEYNQSFFSFLSENM